MSSSRGYGFKSSLLKLNPYFVCLILTVFCSSIFTEKSFILTGMRNIEDLFSASVFCRDRINPYMFVYALSVALLHRPDTRNVPIPPVIQIFPDKYIDGSVFPRARQEANVVNAESRVSIN